MLTGVPVSHKTAEAALTAAALLVAVVLGWFLVTRPGYSPDEEVTVFAVRGILATGLPAMPSGWIYWRGAAYSYLAAALSIATGEEVLTSRALALAAAMCSVVGISMVGRRVAGAGGAAALLLALWPLTASLSGYARFYAPFVALYIAALLALSKVAISRSALWWFVIAAVMARAFQEFALALLLIPIAAAVTEERSDRRRRYIVCAIVSAVAVAIAHVLLTLPQSPAGAAVSHWGFNRLALPETTIGSLPALTIVGTTDLLLLFVMFSLLAIAMRRKWGGDLMFIAAAAAAATVFALGTIVAIVVTAVLLRPAKAVATAISSVALLAVSAAVWVVMIAWRTDIAMSPAFAADLVLAAFRFPFWAARHLSGALPVLAMTVVGGVAWTMWRARGADGAGVLPRALACTLWLHIVAVGVFDIDLRVRHLAMLMPLAAIFAGAIATVILSAALRRSRAMAFGAVCLIGVAAAAMVIEQQRLAATQIERPVRAWWGGWSPPVAQSTLDVRQAPRVAADDVVISNDELAAILRAGRLDYWLAPRPAAQLLTYDTAERVRRGMYAAAELVDADALAAIVATTRATHPVSLVIFHTGKFGIDAGTAVRIAELPDGQRIQTQDWTHIRWRATAR